MFEKIFRELSPDADTEYICIDSTAFKVHESANGGVKKARHVIECLFQKLKGFRRTATRYDKRDDVFPAGVFPASILMLLK